MIYHMVMSRREVLVQLDDDLVAALDAIADATGTNRSALIRSGVRAVLRAHQESEIDAAIARGYAAEPETDTEVAAARAATLALIADEPW